MTTVKLRFVINRNAKGQFAGKQAIDRIPRALTTQIAFEYADRTFNVLRREVEARVESDIQRELAKTSQLLFKHVIGLAGRNLGPTGTLKTVAPQAEGFKAPTQFGLRTTWARRSPRYMKRRAGFGNAWFRRHHPSPLDRLRDPGFWTASFGDIKVTLKKTGTTNRGTSIPMLGNSYATGKKIGVGTLRVEAMSKITPEMLPALGGSPINDYGAKPRSSGLLSMLGSDIANRLGGNPAPNRVPFRPTIQPFLGFFLTRQMPNAVMRRIEQGLYPARWQWTDVTGAGRTR